MSVERAGGRTTRRAALQYMRLGFDREKLRLNRHHGGGGVRRCNTSHDDADLFHRSADDARTSS